MIKKSMTLVVLLILVTSVCCAQTIYVQPGPTYYSTTPMYSMPNGGYYYAPPHVRCAPRVCAAALLLSAPNDLGATARADISTGTTWFFLVESELRANLYPFAVS